MRDTRRVASVVFITLVAFQAASPKADTLVIAFRDASGVYLAADSLTTTVRVFGATGTHETCKLHLAGRFAFAMAGATRESVSGMDLPAMIERHGKSEQASIRAFVTAVNHALPVAMREAVDVVAAKDPGRLTSFVRILDGIRVIIVGRDDDGNLVAIQTAYSASPSGNSVVVKPGPIAYGVSAVGHWSAIGATQATYEPNPKDISAALLRSPVAELRRLMAAQAMLTPSSVGGPVSILRVGTRGPEWIERAAPCR